MDLSTRKDIPTIVAEAIPPSGTLDVTAVIEHTPGEKIAGLPGDYPSGKGGSTRYGAAWFDGLKASAPIALFADQKDAYALIRALTDEDSELGMRKEARRRRIMELEEIEQQQAAEAKAEAKEQAKTLRRAKRNGVDLAEAVGAGSSRPSRSSEKRTDTKPRETRLVRRKA